MGKQALDRFGHVEQLVEEKGNDETLEDQTLNKTTEEEPKASSYWEVMSDKRCFLLCLTGFFFQ
jgi:hypothetical protein